jgi:hypothetical protein
MVGKTTLMADYGRMAQPPGSVYALNGPVIQPQLARLGKRLNHLSEVAPPVYSGLQTDLQDYPRQLARQRADYADRSTYGSIRLRLYQVEERVKAALADHTQRGPNPLTGVSESGTEQKHGRQVLLLPYALLVRRPDYRSKLLYVVLPGEFVTIRKPGHPYCLVQWGTRKGYVNAGMILDLLPHP